MELLKDFKLMKQGAEAKLYHGEYLGKTVVVKERFSKKYRHPALDEHIGKERLKAEARGILRSKAAGIRTPTIFLVDPEKRYIFLEYIDGVTVKDFINQALNENSAFISSCLPELTRRIGTDLAKMHKENIIHGDLTSSNLILKEKELYFIDFGLSFVGNSAEDKSVDLYVLERAILSTHPTGTELFKDILKSYKQENPKGAKEVLIKYEEVKARGRKRTMVG